MGLGACGGAQRPRPHRSLAAQVCGAAARAATTAARAAATGRIIDPDPYSMQCRVTVGVRRLDIADLPSVQAWTEFDTTEVHQLQAYGPGAAHDSAQIPRSIMRTGGVQADWIPAQRELFATDGTQSHGGSYVTVTVSGPPGGQIPLALAVALAAIKAGPAQPAITPPS